MDSFLKVVGILVLVGALVLAGPQVAEQACSDDGDGWSGASPDYPSHEESWYEPVQNTLPPTCN